MPPLTFSHRFALALFRSDGLLIATVPVVRDWAQDHEWGRFYFQRKGLLPLHGGGSATVVPVWEESKLGEPYCRGYRLVFERPGGDPVAAEFHTTHLRRYASSVASEFVEVKKLDDGETFTFILLAYPAPTPAAGAAGMSLSTTDRSPGLPVGNASLEDYLRRAQNCGETQADEMPVFVRPRVLNDAAELTRAHRGLEVGGVLLGFLWQDPSAQEIFAEITAMIPAEHTRGTNVKLTFTPQTWAAAEDALRLRGKGETYLGWLHSHPVFTWCEKRKCTVEQQRQCSLAKDFFSADDESVMRAAFSNAHSVAIVANDTAVSEVTFSMFGNRHGLTQPRGFYVLEGN